MIEALSTTQIGTISEYAVATAILSQSKGRLTPFVPLADDDGVDLIFYDKRTHLTMPVQVKAWVKQPSKAGTVQFDVRKKTFNPDRASMIIAARLNPESTHIVQSWLIPGADIPTLATNVKDKYALAPSTKEGSRVLSD